ncbi:prepilin-type N-terminal cleavage/methylation domain-containing protein [Enterococcus sp. 669A]|uniref:Prepilin-type N-terminal cleavage/methylation domain-containing protein n=1 Tax=Candidatus Enterococcus moelleringii TaxID=2815325 RepID=A0ABS3LEZ0_9ENTE|nr:competence type IV pilus minor pilin ComGD [Enterococcus sp. 669A]MBO1308195.1 prepilin-type N-terminal cleavage/methylation domain-containing protein [Enterococcus sp. 669A]
MKKLKINLKSKCGYTLIESLIVLVVVCSFVLLPTILFASWQQKLERQFFYYQLEKSIVYIQQVAICDQKTTRIDLHQDKQIIYFMAGNEDFPWRELKLPESVVLQSKHSIMFNKNTGNITTNQPESGNIPKISFTDSTGTVNYQFQLGSGRYERQ